jgi:hypothetical protein
MRKVLAIAFGALLLIVAFHQDTFAQGGGSTPTADIEDTCRKSAKSITEIFGEATAVNYDSCMGQERLAREQLVKDWASFTAADRERCANPKQYMPSYVEWLTCFEMEREVRKIRQEQPASAPPAPNARRQSSKSRLSSETRRCPVVEIRADGSIVSIIAC